MRKIAIILILLFTPAAVLAGASISTIGGDVPSVNLITNSRLGSWGNSTLAQGTTGRQTGYEVSVIQADDAEDDDTGDYGLSNCTLAHTVSAGNGAGGSDGYYTVTETGSGQAITFQLSGLTKGRMYKFSLYFKNGTYTIDASDHIDGMNNTATIFYAATFLTGAAAWTEYSVIFTADASNNYTRLYLHMGAGETAFIDEWNVAEVRPGILSLGLGPDGWLTPASIDAFRTERDLPQGIMYGATGTVTVAYDYFQWPLQAVADSKAFYSQFRGKTVTFGAWAKTDTASHMYIAVGDGVTGNATAFHSGSNAWEWLSVSYTVASSATTFYVMVRGATTTKDITFAGPMLVYGEHLPEGSYRPIANELVFMEGAEKFFYSFSNDTFSADKIIYSVQAETSGKAPYDAKGVLVELIGECATIEKALYVNHGAEVGPMLYSQAANIVNSVQGLVFLQWQDMMDLTRNATFNSVYIDMIAVQY